MGLLPLEFTDCLTDSPYFRDNLSAHEKELDRTSQAVKGIIRDIKELLTAAKTLSRAQRNLATTFQNFSFECIGNSQTDDEIIIAGSLKEFGRLLSSIEDERDRIVDSAQVCFIEPLENFRKDHIGAAKEEKKKFEKETVKFCQSLERHLNMSSKKTENHIQEADASLDLEQRHFVQASLDYVLRLQEVHESKKFEFVERILLFMSRWLTFYHQGYEVCTEFKSFMRDLQMRIERTKINFDATKNEAAQLKNKMLSKLHDPGSLNRMYTRQGYLFLLEKKALGTTCTKHFCQYQKDTKKFAMIAFSQATNKILSSETLSVQKCLVRNADSIDKRFCFDIIVSGKSTPYTFQALSEKDYKLWLEAMDGKETNYNQGGRNIRQEDYLLDDVGFNFVHSCIDAIEGRGLTDQGLYRVVGVTSKVTKLIGNAMEQARKMEMINLMDNEEFETKTITSALKTYFRNLPEPLMSFKLHGAFVAAAKQENFEKRINDIHALVQFLPSVNRKMLEVLAKHLRKVSQHADKNLMTVSNLGVCFGPTLLRPEEETMASIMDIKFCNVTVEVLIDNLDVIFGSKPPNDYHSPVAFKQENKASPLATLRNQSSSSLSETDGRPLTNRQENTTKENNRSTPTTGVTYHQHLRSTSNSSKFWVDNRSSSNFQNHHVATNNYTVPVSPIGPMNSSGANHSNLTVPDKYARGNGALNNSGGRVRQNPAYITNPMWQDGNGSSNIQTNHVSPEPNPAYARVLPNNSAVMTNFTSPQILQSQFHVQVQSSQHSAVVAQHVNQSQVPVPQRVSYHSPPNSSPVAQHSPAGRYLPEPRSPNTTGPPKQASSNQMGRKVRTLYACVGENELELTFKPNEIINNVKPSQEPGWLEGCLNGRVGLVPENYVEFIN